VVTPEVDPPDEIAQAAADDVKSMFQRSGLREIVQLANDVAARESVSPEQSPLPERSRLSERQPLPERSSLPERAPLDERRYSA
jgi:hypothetical protein